MSDLLEIGVTVAMKPGDLRWIGDPETSVRFGVLLTTDDRGTLVHLFRRGPDRSLVGYWWRLRRANGTTTTWHRVTRIDGIWPRCACGHRMGINGTFELTYDTPTEAACDTASRQGAAA